MPRPYSSHHDRKRDAENRTSGNKTVGTAAAGGGEGSESAGGERGLDAFGFNQVTLLNLPFCP